MRISLVAILAVLVLVYGCTDRPQEPVNPALVPNPTDLQFSAYLGSLAPNAYIQVGVRDLDTVVYALTASDAWIELPTRVRNAPDSFFLKVLSDGLAVGMHNGTVTLESSAPPGLTATINVAVEIRSVLQLSGTAFNYVATSVGPVPDSQALIISSNDPARGIPFTLQSGANWLLPSATAGTTPDTVFLFTDQDSVSPGQYETLLTVSSDSVPNSPLYARCSLSVYSWVPQNSPFPQGLRDVSFSDPMNGCIVGLFGGGTTQNGFVLYTSDGGDNWEVWPNLEDSALSGVDMVSATEGWAVGVSGRVLHTTNGGATWLPQPSGVSDNLWDVDFVSAETGLAVGVGGRIIRTTDGGSSWDTVSSGVSFNLSAVILVDEQYGWAVGNLGTVIQTEDGGESWKTQSVGLSNDLWDVYFADASNGWLVGETGLIMHTDNGGVSWSTQVSGTNAELRGVVFASELRGWAAGANGTILQTSDGGVTWAPQFGGTDIPYLYGVWFTDQDNGWIVGEGGVILNTKSGGE